MAIRYLVSVASAWNASNTAIWSASSGGASGASAPTNLDAVIIDTASPGGTLTVAAGADCLSLTVNWTAVKTNAITLSADFAPNAGASTITIAGNSVTNRILVQSSVLGTARTITAAVAVPSNCDFMDIIGAGAATWSGTSLGDCLGNSGITFTPAATQYYQTAVSASWSDATKWFLGSNGTGGAGRVPLPQDNVVFDAYSVTTTGKTITADMPRMGKDITWTGVANSPVFSSSVAWSVFGSWTAANAMTLNEGHTITFMGRGSHSVTSSGLTFNNAVYFFAVGGTYTLADALSINHYFVLGDGTVTATGNVTAKYVLIYSGRTAKVANLGSGVWTVTSVDTLNAWVSLPTLTTINAQTSTIKLTDSSATAKYFQGGGATYNNVWFSGTGTGAFVVTGSNTFNQLKDDNPAAPLQFTAGTTQTIADPQLNGTISTPLVITSSTSASHTLTKSGGGTVSAQYLSLSYSTATPSSTWTAFESINGGNNSGWIWGWYGYGSEAATATDSVGATYIADARSDEAGTAADAPSSGGIFPAQQSEAAAATATVSSVGIFPAQQNEAGIAADAPSSGGIFPAQQNETSTAADIVGVFAVYPQILPSSMHVIRTGSTFVVVEVGSTFVVT